MKINDNFPTPIKLIDNEIETLRFLYADAKINENYKALSKAAGIHLAKYKNKGILSFKFDSRFELEYETDHYGTAFFGVCLEASDRETFEFLSYYLAITDYASNRIVRKYHFDYDIPRSEDRQPRPIFHLQYAGEISQILQNSKCEYEHLDSWMSVPRIYHMPMSLAFIFNLILLEFPDDKNMKLIENSEYCDLIRSNEKLLLEPFIGNCHRFFTSPRNNQLFVNDFYYGKN